MSRSAFLLLLVAAGCQPRTEVMIGLATDIRAPDVLDSAQITVFRTSDDFPEQMLPPWTLSGLRDVPFNLPGSYGVYSPDGTAQKIRVELVGYKGQTTVVNRTAILSLVPGKTLFLRMGLVAGCMNRTDCGPTQSCVEGQCVNREVDTSILPDFTDELVTTLTCNSGTRFINTEDGSPMAMAPDAQSCPGVCIEGTCLVPNGSNGHTDTPDGGKPNPMGDGGIVGGADFGIVNDGGPTTTGCPGEVAGMGQMFAPAPMAISSIASDGQHLFFTDSGAGVVMSVGPCGNPQVPITTGQTAATGLVVASGQVFWITGSTIRGAPANSTMGAGVFTVTAQATGNLGVLATDGANLYYTTSTAVMRVPAIPNAPAPTAVGAATTVSSINKQLTAGPDQIAWYASNNTTINWMQLSNPTNTKTYTVQISRGIVANGSNLAFTDYANGLNFVPTLGGTAMNIQPATVWNGTPGRVSTDGTYLYVMSFNGTNDRVVRVDAKNTAMPVVTGIAGSASSTINPAFVANSSGIYWVDGTDKQIFRAPAPP